jgi:hypothetical protein
MAEGRDKKWLDLCQAAATEQDPNKLAALVSDLIKALDERDGKRQPNVKNNDDCGVFPSLNAA